MTVKELITKLKKFDPSKEVVMYRDAEGNGTSPLAIVESIVYNADTSWVGEVYDPKWSANEAGMPAKEWNKLKKENGAVLLIPWN